MEYLNFWQYLDAWQLSTLIELYACLAFVAWFTLEYP